MKDLADAHAGYACRSHLWTRTCRRSGCQIIALAAEPHNRHYRFDGPSDPIPTRIGPNCIQQRPRLNGMLVSLREEASYRVLPDFGIRYCSTQNELSPESTRGSFPFSAGVRGLNP